ncbi:MAG: Hsp20/alpha crystallin family protein [Gammaproteobacteria bacterium]|nr:Hsp20/alpha crystallin family protein [Gammaproteobacteria bacterium]MDH3559406.1 Hsp20/alpha crystallin family protein [Gammaproteobacteria bacterium]
MTTQEKTPKREIDVKHRPATPVLNAWEDMERWFEELGRRGWLHPVNWEWPRSFEARAPFEGKTPKVDMIDRDMEITIRAELPGVEKDNLDITVSDHNVTIKAQTQYEEKEEQEEYYRHEMSHGEYQRTLELPVTVDEQKAKATFKNGILELRLPKMEKTPRRQVRVE